MDKQERAAQVYQQFKSHLDSHDFDYSPHDDDMVITLTVKGDDFPIPVMIRVLGEREVVRLSSPIPGEFPEDKRIDAAVAIAAINYRLLNGSFILDMDDGSVAFRICQCYHDNDISDEQIRYLFSMLFMTTDEFNDTLFMMAKGLISLEQVIEKVSH